MKSNFEEIGGTYTKQGDYFLPNLTVKNTEERSIGILGNRRKTYLKNYHRVLYYNMLTSETLFEHLADINEQADNHMKWVQIMNSIRNRATEIVNEELIY